MVQSCCFQKVKAKREKCSKAQGSLGKNKPGPLPSTVQERGAVWTAGAPPGPDTPLPLSTVGNTFPHRGEPWELKGRKKKFFQRLLKILLA